MKHLFLIFLFSGSLDGFSQDTLRGVHYSQLSEADKKTFNVWHEPTPDTLRAICLVTLFPNGIAHARMGYVVIEQGKRPVYLDCRKRALKLPQVGWGYELINPNSNK